MVLSVCRLRLLYDASAMLKMPFRPHFLVLSAPGWIAGEADPLSPWLHGVAYRVAARIRANAARWRRSRRSAAARPERIEPASEVERHELRGILDEEISRLPEKYRRPVVLCYLEGRTRGDRRADGSRCTTGSVRGRPRQSERETAGSPGRPCGIAPAAAGSPRGL